MANKIKKTNQLVLSFRNEANDLYKIAVDRPIEDEALESTSEVAGVDYIKQADKIVNAGIILPNGNAISSVEKMELIDKTIETVDMSVIDKE